jgi:hypothetical protein
MWTLGVQMRLRQAIFKCVYPALCTDIGSIKPSYITTDYPTMIIFTLRELKCAWRQSAAVFFEAADSKTITNAHRLLLFYSVETGLKAVLLKRLAKQDSEDLENFFKNSEGNKRSGHDLNNLMDHLKVGKSLRLHNERILLDDLKLSSPPKQRTAGCGDLNQVWRYGAKARDPVDAMLETQLIAIQEWICGELK